MKQDVEELDKDHNELKELEKQEKQDEDRTGGQRGVGGELKAKRSRY